MSDTTIYFITPTRGNFPSDNTNSGLNSSFVIQPKTIDGPVSGSIRQTTDLVLYGNGTENWGEKHNQNFYRLLENFACPPEVSGGLVPMRHNGELSYGMLNGINNPVQGQFWFNTEDKQMYYFTGQAWIATHDSGTPPSARKLEQPRDIAPPVAPKVIERVIETRAGPTLTLDDLKDVDVSAATENMVLVFSKGAWRPSTFVPSVNYKDITGSIASNRTLAQAFNSKQDVLTFKHDVNKVLVSTSSGEIGTSDISLKALSHLRDVNHSIQGQLDEKAPLRSPTLSGTPTAPTPELSDSSDQIATTKFVKDLIEHRVTADVNDSTSIEDDYVEDDPLVVMSEALQQVDAASEEARLKYITGGVGQAMIYQEKMEEALDFATAGYPEGNIADYPFISIEAEIQGISGQDAADQILARATTWRQKGVAIERERRLGKLLIQQQNTITEIKDVLQQITDKLSNI